MTVMIMSDIHYEKDFHHRTWEGEAFKWIESILEQHKPTDLVILGDTGYAWDEEEWETLLEKVTIHAIYGNHDNVQMLKGLRNTDRMRVWARNGEARNLGKFKFGFFNGIMGNQKERRRRFTYRENYGGINTDITFVPRFLPEELEAGADILSHERVDVLCTHASIPMPDELQRFHWTKEFEALKTAEARIRPRMWFSGHLSGPYKVGQIDETACRFVRVDSSPQEKHYLLLSDKILICHDYEQVLEVNYP